MFEDMKINTNMSTKMEMIVTCTFFTWPLPLFNTDMDMDIIKDIYMNEHLHVYELEYEKVHVHVNVMFPLTFHHSGQEVLGLGQRRSYTSKSFWPINHGAPKRFGL